MNTSKGSRYIFLCFLAFILVVISFFLLEVASGDLTEGSHPIYIVKEVVEVTSPFTHVTWIQGPYISAVRYRVIEGADCPDLDIRVSGLSVHIVKHLYDTTRVVVELEALALKGSSLAKVSIEAGALGHTNVKVSGYDIAASEFVELGEINDGAITMTTYELDISTLYNMPSAEANVEEGVKDLKQGVFAFYYPWYASPEGPSGYWEHWPSGYAHEPLMGLYDSADESVILAHMAMAKNAGIDGFIAIWWGIGTFEGDQFEKILGVAERIGFNVTIYYAGLPWREVDVDDAVRELSYVVDNYADSPVFLKDSGRPVIFIYAAETAPDGAREPDFWFDVRRRLEAEVGPVALNADVWDSKYSQVFDGFHSYVYLGDEVEDYFTDTIKRFKVYLSSYEALDEAFSSAYSGGSVNVELKPFCVTVIPGADFRAIGGDMFLDRDEGEFYAEYWRAALELEAHSVLITSWNEWHEGTEIEPSNDYGFDYIRLTRQFIEDYKEGPMHETEAGFSATVESLVQRPDLSGDGSIVVMASETPAVYVNVSITGDEGVSFIDLNGDFAYKKELRRNKVSILAPSTRLEDNLVVNVVYRAVSIKPTFSTSVVTYDVSGRMHTLFNAQLRPTVLSSLTASVTDSVEITEPIVVSGFSYPEGEGRSILLSYTRPDSSILTRMATTSSSGFFTDSLLPDVAGNWRLQASWAGDAEIEGSTSQVHLIIVRGIHTSISTQTSLSRVTEGEVITISGSMSPPLSAAEVSINITKPGGSIDTVTSITDSDGFYTYSYTPTEPGLWSVEASWGGDSRHEAASSAAQPFEVAERNPLLTPLGVIVVTAGVLVSIAVILAWRRT